MLQLKLSVWKEKLLAVRTHPERTCTWRYARDRRQAEADCGRGGDSGPGPGHRAWGGGASQGQTPLASGTGLGVCQITEPSHSLGSSFTFISAYIWFWIKKKTSHTRQGVLYLSKI